MNYSYAIISDSTSDLNPDLRSRFQVDGCIKGYISTPHAENIEARLDLSDAELEKFYDQVKASKNGYTTSPPSVDEMALYFETFLQQGKDILALAVSTALSATYKFMLAAKDIVLAKYPERRIFVVDSRRVSTSLALLTIKACALRAEGMTIEKNAETLDKIKNSIHQMGTLDDLYWVASKGRISNAKAFFGTLAGIKALGDYDGSGMVTPIAKISGYKKAFKAVIEYIKRTIKNPESQTIIVGQSARLTQTEVFVGLLREHVKPKNIIVCPVQQTSGINIGPGMVAAYYFGTEITDMQFEKDIINDIIANKL